MNIEHSQTKNEKKTMLVVAIAAITMCLELVVGFITNSMALLADGWHMASHVGAIGAAFLAYRFARKHSDNPNFANGTDKILSLTGYTSALFLGFFAVVIAYESIERIIEPKVINFEMAIPVAVLGLIVNLASARILHDKEPHHDHSHDHNARVRACSIIK